MNDPDEADPWRSDAAAAAARLGVDPAAGLPPAEIAARRARHGANALRVAARRSAAAILVHQLGGIIFWLLTAAAAFSLYLGDMVEALAIVVVLAINTVIGFVSEWRAARSMEALHRIAAVATRVRRGGEARMIDAKDLVPGDIVLLDAGDVVTADMRLLELSNLHVDESVLTGESVPVTKQTGALDAGALVAERTNMAFKGTAITEGTAEAVVTATGMATELGRISDLTQQAEAEISPLEKRLDRLGHKLVWLTLGLTAAIVLVGVLRGHALAAMIETGIALAVAAVPEGLPVVATLCLARGMWRMAQRNALVSRLSAVETLGATTVILTDKTGTLTENRMSVAGYLLDGAELDSMAAASDGSDVLRQAVEVGALCNTATLGTGGERSGDPMELALLDMAAARGQDRASLVAARPEASRHAFEAERKMMATVHEGPEGFMVAVKGAPEAVLDVCDSVAGPDGIRPLDAQARADWATRIEAAAGRGLRLLGLATKTVPGADAPPYEGLTLLAMVCLSDPVRGGVPEAIGAARAAGVRVVMMTGDHATTAAEIARQAGLRPAAGSGALSVMEGADLAAMDLDAPTEAMGARIIGTDVFARVAPEDKLKIVTLFQKAGQVVAMTGDGVNDAPALKKADIGIAMGRRGTQVAREAADMVLNDDAFSTIVAAMRQGRVIFANIRKFVVYLMSCNVSEVLVVGLAVGAGLPAPLLPLQILFLNLVTDVFPAFALGLGRGDEGVMRRPPRDPAEPIVDARRWAWIAGLGALITVATLGAFLAALYWLALPPAQAVTVAFVTLALAQLWNVFNMRAPGSGMLVNELTRNPWIWGALGLCLVLIAAAVWVPVLSQVLKLPPPGGPGILLAAGCSLFQPVAGQIALRFLPPERPASASPR